MNILITGASGFLGSALARRFGEVNHKISLLVRRDTNLYRLRNLVPYTVGRCESDQEIIQFITQTCPDLVIHTACCYGRNGESLPQIIDSNIRFGLLVLDAIKNLKKEVAFINTGTVLSRNVSLYSLTKIQFEELGSSFASASSKNIQFINIKLQHMYGPGDDNSKFTSHIINSCRNNIPALPLTLGEQKRDFIYIGDVVEAYLKIAENLAKLHGNQEIELGSGTALRVRDFVELAHKLTNSKTELLFGQIPYKENDSMCMVANIDKLKNLGWVPEFDIEAGIKKTIEMDLIR